MVSTGCFLVTLQLLMCPSKPAPRAIMCAADPPGRRPISDATRKEFSTPSLSRQIRGAPIVGTRSAFIYGLSSGGHLVQTVLQSHPLLTAIQTCVVRSFVHEVLGV